ncbi:hypothetical protein MLD38_032970 [Melastoma candidum]|uniref:Uncharacterized protein n=1 Tax=Melastoma candidum TaxID=119954 RepID=A0ACB9M8Z9_9MYRT|nr:hypothetical protein MLD38_032970 [Melastoma candidum]
MEYTTFLKSLPVVSALEESQRMTAMRKIYRYNNSSWWQWIWTSSSMNLPSVEGPTPDVDIVLSICLQSNLPAAPVGKVGTSAKQLNSGHAPSTSEVSGSSKRSPGILQTEREQAGRKTGRGMTTTRRPPYKANQCQRTYSGYGRSRWPEQPGRPVVTFQRACRRLVFISVGRGCALNVGWAPPNCPIRRGLDNQTNQPSVETRAPTRFRLRIWIS